MNIEMSQPIPFAEGTQHCLAHSARMLGIVLGLQGITLAWMLAEAAIALLDFKSR